LKDLIQSVFLFHNFGLTIIVQFQFSVYVSVFIFVVFSVYSVLKDLI